MHSCDRKGSNAGIILVLLLTLASLALAACGYGTGGRASENADSAPPRGPSTLDFTDPRGDVRSVDGAKRGDIVSGHVEHSATHLIISTTFARLDQGAAYRVAPSVIADGTYWVAEWEGAVANQPAMRLYYRGNVDDTRPCDGFSRSVNYSTDVVTLSIPRGCLRNPSWVRVSLFVLTWHPSGAATRDSVQHDGPRRFGGERFSQRIYAQ